MRQWHLVEYISDYDFFLLFHSKKSNAVADALSRKNMGIIVATIVQEWSMMEDLKDYLLTFIKPIEPTNLYELIVRPILIN